MLRCAIASTWRTPHAHSTKGSNPMRQLLPPIILPLTTSYQRQAYTLLCGMSHHIHAAERTQRHPVPLASPAALITRAKPAANCRMPDRPLYRPLLRASLSCCSSTISLAPRDYPRNSISRLAPLTTPLAPHQDHTFGRRKPAANCGMPACPLSLSLVPSVSSASSVVHSVSFPTHAEPHGVEKQRRNERA